MSDFAYYPQQYEAAPVQPQAAWMHRSIERSRWTWLLFVPSLMGAGVSWMAGGLQFITDVSFLLFTVVSVGLLLSELFKINTRWGIGGLTLYGGCVVWFCYDYLAHWFMIDA